MPDIALRDFYERYIAVLNAHEAHRMEEFVHDRITLHGEPSTRAAVVAQLSGILDAVPDMHWETEEIAVDGERLAARVINTGTPAKEWLGVAPSGRSFEIVEFAIYTIRDGRFLHLSSMHDAETLQKQLKD